MELDPVPGTGSQKPLDGRKVSVHRGAVHSRPLRDRGDRGAGRADLLVKGDRRLDDVGARLGLALGAHGRFV